MVLLLLLLWLLLVFSSFFPTDFGNCQVGSANEAFCPFLMQRQSYVIVKTGAALRFLWL